MIQSVIDKPLIGLDAPFIWLIKSNAVFVTIQKLTDVNSYAVIRREIDRICLDYHLIYTPEGGQEKFTSRFSKTAANCTYIFRFNLCNWLAAYREQFPQVTKPQLIGATSLTSRALDRVSTHPHEHHRSVTQLHQFATSLGVTFTKVISNCLNRDRLSLPRVNPEAALNLNSLGL